MLSDDGGGSLISVIFLLALHLPKLLEFSLSRKDHSLRNVGDQLLQVVIAVDFQKPGHVSVEIEHSRLFLRGENEGLYRD
jgi:hypothetical protein